MRIAFANRFSVAVGGAEEFIRRISPLLAERGHELAFFFEHAWPGQPISPPDATTWFVEERGATEALKQLRAWGPDITYCHGLVDPSTEMALARLGPSVYSAHGYFGTCISGRKMHAFPSPSVCQKVFGPACLAQYLPRRCGGLSPLTMLKKYGVEQSRLQGIRAYSSVVVHSNYMQKEYLRHGVETTVVPLPAPEAEPMKPLGLGGERHVLFVGRLSALKGCDILIDAADKAAVHLPSLRITIAGDGEQRADLEARARAARSPNLFIHFAGRVSREQRDALLRSVHAIAVPSVWPEPFGMVGLEAGAFGVPAVAFRVGGIPEWLKDGVSGCLATPPTAQALARAVLDCISDPGAHARLSAGARAFHMEFSKQNSVDALEKIFLRVTATTFS